VPRLADSEDYQLAARALVGLNAYGGGMASRGLSLEEFNADCPCDMSELSVDERIEIIKSKPLLEPFSLAAMGHAFDSDEAPTYLVLALVHENARAAEINAERLIDRLRLDFSSSEDVMAPDALFWGNQISFVEVSVDGRVLLAKLYESRDKATDSTTWPYWVLFGGGVLIHE
jgi:hypothetical protein